MNCLRSPHATSTFVVVELQRFYRRQIGLKSDLPRASRFFPETNCVEAFGCSLLDLWFRSLPSYIIRITPTYASYVSYFASVRARQNCLGPPYSSRQELRMIFDEYLSTRADKKIAIVRSNLRQEYSSATAWVISSSQSTDIHGYACALIKHAAHWHLAAVASGNWKHCYKLFLLPNATEIGPISPGPGGWSVLAWIRLHFTLEFLSRMTQSDGLHGVDFCSPFSLLTT